MITVDEVVTPDAESSSKTHSKGTCLDSFPGATERGRLTEDIAIIQSDRGWFLVREPLHTSDVVAILGTVTPVPDPCTDQNEYLLDEDSDEGRALWEATNAWDEMVDENFTLLIGSNPRHIWRFVNDLVDEGYDPNTPLDVQYWVYNYVAAIIDDALPAEESA